MNNKIIKKTLAISIILLLQACIFSKDKCDYIPYLFEVTVEISPIVDTVFVGDTLWLSAQFSDLVYEKNTAEFYKLENFDFHTHFGLARIDTEAWQDANTKFAFLLEKGELNYIPLTSNLSKIIIGYEYENNEYSFRIGTIPLEKGTYYMSYSSSWVDFEDNPSLNFVPNCDREYVEGINYAVNTEENNYYLIETSPDTLVRAFTFADFNISSAYAFVVTE